MNPIKIGVAGLGRSGWSIHFQTLKDLPEFQVVAAMDFDAARREEAAALGARPYDSFEALIKDEEVEAIVVATPNFLHREHIVGALDAGKHAICEKPFGTTSEEADAMIEAARRNDKLVVPFQNRRYEAHFQKVREVLESGVLGEIHLIRLCAHSFSRRWDWQTLREYSGGQLTNWGPHIVDYALQLMNLAPDATPEIWVDLRNVLSSGDADDHIEMLLRSPAGGPVVQIEISAAMAYPQDNWHIAGKSGGLRGTPGNLEWKWVDWSAMPPRPVERTPTPGRSYNREELNWQTESWSSKDNPSPEPTAAFYGNFAQSVREGAPLDITPQSVRQQIAVIERAKELGGFA